MRPASCTGLPARQRCAAWGAQSALSSGHVCQPKVKCAKKPRGKPKPKPKPTAKTEKTAKTAKTAE
eukprot:15472016-Alexandrium_andersonii.AAC.1